MSDQNIIFFVPLLQKLHKVLFWKNLTLIKIFANIAVLFVEYFDYF